MKFYLRWVLVGLVFLILFTKNANATHIRAGEITVERVSCQSLTFRITITGWVDLESTVEFGGGDLDFGDGSEPINLRQRASLTANEDLGNNVGMVQFQIEHTYGANGVYTLTYLEANRNAGILNMDNSVNTTFYIETLIIIDPFLGCNNTPVMLIAPIDEACPGSIFFHNPGAWDIDGDSISYELTIPKREKGTDVTNYRFPNDNSFGASTEDGNFPSIFDIDIQTGDIIWDAPLVVGEYNIAFVIKEWRRKGGQVFLMSLITRDMQIIVEDCDNERPELQIPEDICVEAGTFIEEIIVGTDPDNDNVKIEAFGGPFEVRSDPAVFIPTPSFFQPQPSFDTIQWQTNCFHVRTQPYQVTFKITDQPHDGPKLVGFEAWNITVVAPAPEAVGISVNANRTIDLTWDEYFCQNARAIQVWRRVDSYDFAIEDCVLGIPEFAGYELIGEVGPSISSFLDENRVNPTNGLPSLNPDASSVEKLFLDFGANYCYRLVAVFPDPAGGKSYASVEVCGIIQADAPVITNVTVDETDNANGQITIKWRRPFEIDPGLFPPPYFYDLYRVSRLHPFAKDPVPDTLLIASNLLEMDTVFADSGLDTDDEEYHYFLMLKDNNGVEIRSSANASMVFLEPKPLFKEIELHWEANVPWSNNTQDFPIHYIYRDHVVVNENELVLIDSVNVNEEGFIYVDSGQSTGTILDEKTEYCYFVLTQGSYGNLKIQEPLLNFSQIICAQPNDTIPPCAPIVEVATTDCEVFFSDKSCGYNDFSNRVIWRRDDECQEETIKEYNVYFTKSGSTLDDFPDQPIATVESLEFVHEGLSSFAGCYYVTAIDRSGNESPPSNIACNDNCPNYDLPNVFTPNGDGINDVFNALNMVDNPDLDPLNCPRFVQQVSFKVINRYGKEVYTYLSGGENSILIGWDGRSNKGDQLSSGVYYYIAEIDYEAISPALKKEVLNGWVQILR